MEGARKYIKNMIKKIIFSLSMGLICISSYGQKEVTLKAGTLVPIQSVNKVAATDVAEGSTVNFRVSRDINVEGITAIPYGTMVKGKVTEAKRSSWWGTKGRLRVQINEIVMPNGEVVPITNGNIAIYGQNRTALSVVLFCFVTIPACFICGSKAEMQEGYEIQANIAANTTVKCF